jgi:hypothetical protein
MRILTTDKQHQLAGIHRFITTHRREKPMYLHDREIVLIEARLVTTGLIVIGTYKDGQIQLLSDAEVDVLFLQTSSYRHQQEKEQHSRRQH